MASSEESQVIGCHSVDEFKKHFAESVDSKKLVFDYYFFLINNSFVFQFVYVLLFCSFNQQIYGVRAIRDFVFYNFVSSLLVEFLFFFDNWGFPKPLSRGQQFRITTLYW